MNMYEVISEAMKEEPKPRFRFAWIRGENVFAVAVAVALMKVRTAQWDRCVSNCHSERAACPREKNLSRLWHPWHD